MADANLAQYDAAFLRECFALSDDGTLVWRIRPASHFATQRGLSVFNSKIAGSPAGSLGEHGYLVIGLGRTRRLMAHRVVFCLTHGFDPAGDIDHINGDKADNRPQNLRAATRSQNNANKGASAKSASGYKGVTWHKQIGRWRARIKINGKQLHIGCFGTPDEAARAYNEKARELFGDFARPTR